jgi:hypothetical protein
MEAPIQIQHDAAKAEGFCPEMSLATNLAKIPLQKESDMHSPNFGWKIDAYGREVHCDARQ